jgi:hypothetical protein
VDKRTQVQELRQELARMHGRALSREDLIRCEAIREISLVSTDEEINAIYFAGDAEGKVWNTVLKEVFQRLNLPPDTSMTDRLKVLRLTLTLLKDEKALESVELGVGDWLKTVAAKAVSLIKSVWKKVTGAIFPGPPRDTTRIRVSVLGPGGGTGDWIDISKGGRWTERFGGTEITIDSLGREWREADHPRNPDGTFRKSTGVTRVDVVGKAVRKKAPVTIITPTGRKQP